MNIRNHLFLPLLSALLSLALTACGGGGGGSGSAGLPSAPPTGIASTYYPATTGSRWAYEGTSSNLPAPYLDEIVVTNPRIVSGETALVFSERNPAGTDIPLESYYIKDARAFSFLGDNDASDWLTAAIGRFDLMRFNGTFSATPLIDKTGIDVGVDLDGDGAPERLDIRVTGMVEGYETRTVAAGSFSNTARIRYDVVGSLKLSTGATVAVTQSVYDWRTPEIGSIRQSITTGVGNQTSNDTIDLRGVSVNGLRAGTMLPQILSSGLAPADSDATRPGPPALASDGNRFLLVSNRETATGRQWFGQWMGADGMPATALDLSPPLGTLPGAPAVSHDGSNYLVVTSDSNRLRGQRVSTAGALLDVYPGIAIAADAFNPAVAFGSGTSLVVYRKSTIPGAIFGVNVSPAGVASAEFSIASGATDSVPPAVAFDGSNFLVAWEAGDALSSPAATDLQATRISPAGVVLNATPIAVSTAPEAQTAPKIACDVTNCLISWIDRRNYPGQSYSFSPGPGDMYGAFVSRSGQVLNPDGLAIATGISANAGYPGLAFTGTEYLIAWSSGAFVNNPGGPTGIYATRVSPTGVVSASAPGLTISGPPAAASTLRYVTVTASPTGALVAWLNNIELAGSSKSLSGAILYPPIVR
jgi:hypothetical protein